MKHWTNCKLVTFLETIRQLKIQGKQSSIWGEIGSYRDKKGKKKRPELLCTWADDTRHPLSQKEDATKYF